MLTTWGNGVGIVLVMSETAIFTNSRLQLQQVRERLRPYFSMPEQAPTTLPEKWLALTKLSAWPLASIVAGLIPYLLILGLSLLVESQGWFWAADWRFTLHHPLITIYLLLLIPVFHQILGETAEAFLPLLPATNDHEAYLRESYHLKPRREWLIFCLGVLVGWAITPTEGLGNGWQIAYAYMGDGLNIGLLSWLAYSVAVQTKILTSLHNQTQGLNVPKRGILTPMGRWSNSLALAFIVGSLVSNTILPQEDLLSPKNVIIYSIVNLLVMFVFLRNSESASLLAQFRILRAFSLFVLVALAGTLGYHYIEGWPPLDGLYMTVITMTTIGYGEIGPLGPAGRVFTIVLGLVSVGIAGYAISAVVAFIFEGDFQRALGRQKMNKEIANLQNHIILCGAGYTGEQIATEFVDTQTPFVVIEQDQTALDQILRLADIPYLLGDATRDETLLLAGIERARGLIANLNDDKDNAFIVLSAKDLNSKLRIVTRLTDDDNAEKLRKVGADEIVSPSAIGGLRIASVMIRPSVVNFLDEMIRDTKQTVRVEEMQVDQRSSLIGQTLTKANIEEKTGLLLVAIRTADGNYHFNPPKKTTLQSQDTLIVMGTPDQLQSLQRIG